MNAADETTRGQVVIWRPDDLPPGSTLADEVRESLTAVTKWLPSKFHYDARGSEIFEEITRLEEYYPTRTELGILERIADGLVAETRPRALVEFGSGSASKTRSILDAMERAKLLDGYGAIEVSEAALRGSAEVLLERYPDLSFEGIVADFTSPVGLPFAGSPRLILFLGSTIGNMTHGEGASFLAGIATRMTAEDRLLIGFDLVKDIAVLEAAYNDSEGVTEQFSLNLLRVINRELAGDLPLDAFRHVARYDVEEARIEANVVAQRPVRARLAAIDLDLDLAEGDRIRTEYSHKYTAESAGALLAAAGFELARWETDGDALFAVALARPSSAKPSGPEGDEPVG